MPDKETFKLVLVLSIQGLEGSKAASNIVRCSCCQGWFAMKRELLLSTLYLPDVTARDQISQAFPLRIRNNAYCKRSNTGGGTALE